MGVSLQQFSGLLLTITHCKSGRQFEGVQSVQIAACGQDVRVVQQITARCRQGVTTVEGAQQAVEFTFLAQEQVGFHQLVQGYFLCVIEVFGMAVQRLFAGAIYKFLQQTWLLDAHGHRHGFQGGKPLVARGQLPDDMQALWNQGVLQLEQLINQGGDPRLYQLSLCLDLFRDAQFQFTGLLVNHDGQVTALFADLIVQCAPAVQRLLQILQPFVQA